MVITKRYLIISVGCSQLKQWGENMRERIQREEQEKINNMSLNKEKIQSNGLAKAHLCSHFHSLKHTLCILDLGFLLICDLLVWYSVLRELLPHWYFWMLSFFYRFIDLHPACQQNTLFKTHPHFLHMIPLCTLCQKLSEKPRRMCEMYNFLLDRLVMKILWNPWSWIKVK